MVPQTRLRTTEKIEVFQPRPCWILQCRHLNLKSMFVGPSHLFLFCTRILMSSFNFFCRYKVWRMTVDQVMPSESTTYHCTTHRSPRLTAKHQIIAFNPYLVGPDALKHSHHFI